MKMLYTILTVVIVVVEQQGGGGVMGHGNHPPCEMEGKHIPFGYSQKVGPCKYCQCGNNKQLHCEETVPNPPTSCPRVLCANPITPPGECCEVCLGGEEVVCEYPEFSGFSNNLARPHWGTSGSTLLRAAIPAAYEDSVQAPRESHLSARHISNTVVEQVDEETATDESIVDPRGLSGLIWQWGQFVDHDITLVTELVEGAESFPIEVPEGDSFPEEELHFQRANWDRTTGTTTRPRRHVNSISSFIDGSNLYGSDEFVGQQLRSHSEGRLKEGDAFVSPGNPAETATLLPDNEDIQIVMAALPGQEGVFAAGDIRANEQGILTSMHTLWVWEHNYWAEKLADRFSHVVDDTVRDEKIFQEARKRVIAEMQQITYDEWLVALLGTPLPQYKGYNNKINVGLTTEFSGAVYRFGHSMIAADYPSIVYNDGEFETAYVNSLSDLFFNSEILRDSSGPKALLRGIVATPAQRVDTKAVDPLRSNLFRGHMDLAALNIQRGRDMGIPTYNDFREKIGLDRKLNIDHLASHDEELVKKLNIAYPSGIDEIDLWIGMLAEAPTFGSVGEVIGTVLFEQFCRLRDGDRFYWQNWLTKEEIEEIGGADGVVRIKDIFDRHMPELQKLGMEHYFFCVENELSEHCARTCPPTLVPCDGGRTDKHGNPIMVHQDPDKDCAPYQCPCEACDASKLPPSERRRVVCGSDGTTYDNICELEQERCRSGYHSLHVLHEGDCWVPDYTLTFTSNLFTDGSHIGELLLSQSLYGGPIKVEGKIEKVARGGGTYSAQIVTDCVRRTPFNALGSPMNPLQPVVKDLFEGDEGGVAFTRLIHHGLSLVNAAHPKHGDDGEVCTSTDILSLLNTAVLIYKMDDPDAFNVCGGIQGASSIRLGASIEGRRNGDVTVELSQVLSGGDIVRIDVEIPEDSPVGHYQVNLVDSCDNQNEVFISHESSSNVVSRFQVHETERRNDGNNGVMTFSTNNDVVSLVGHSTLYGHSLTVQFTPDDDNNNRPSTLGCSPIVRIRDNGNNDNNGNNGNDGNRRTTRPNHTAAKQRGHRRTSKVQTQSVRTKTKRTEGVNTNNNSTNGIMQLGSSMLVIMSIISVMGIVIGVVFGVLLSSLHTQHKQQKAEMVVCEPSTPSVLCL